MSNIYEQLLLNDKTALESKIKNLVEQKLNDCEEAEEELDLISKIIDFSMDIGVSCSFEVDCPVLTATKTFDSVEDYKDRDHYETAEDAECDGISWDADTNEGSFYWSGRPSVSVEVEGLTEHASGKQRRYGRHRARSRNAKNDWIGSVSDWNRHRSNCWNSKQRLLLPKQTHKDP